MGNCVMVLARWKIDASLLVRCPVVAPSVQPPPAQFAKPLAAYDFGFFCNAISRVQNGLSNQVEAEDQKKRRRMRRKGRRRRHKKSKRTSISKPESKKAGRKAKHTRIPKPKDEHEQA